MSNPQQFGNSKQLLKVWEMMTRIPDQISVVKDIAVAPVLTRSLELQLNKLIARRSLFFPNFQEHNQTVAVFSDYGGESTDSRYYVYSFLVCSFNALGAFHEAQSQLRVEHKLNNPMKELAFKSLNYGPQLRSLPGYLRNLNNCVPGILISVVIEKGSLSIWGSDKKSAQRETAKALSDAGLGEWTAETAEKLVTVVHLVSYFIALLAESGQKILWQSDNDAIMANGEKLTHAAKLLGSTLNLYTSKKFGTIGCAKSFGKDSTFLLDLLSAPDLVAGSIEHFLTRQDRMDELTLKNGVNQILAWHAYQGIALKKYSFIFRSGKNGSIISGYLDIKATIPPSDAEFIEIQSPLQFGRTPTDILRK